MSVIDRRVSRVPIWSIKTPYLTEDKSLVSEGEEHHVNNDDEIDESHRLHEILI